MEIKVINDFEVKCITDLPEEVDALYDMVDYCQNLGGSHRVPVGVGVRNLIFLNKNQVLEFLLIWS